MYDDNEIEEEILKQIADRNGKSLESEFFFKELSEDESPDPLAAYQVRCEYGCGFYYVPDLQHMVSLGEGFIEFRCPNCNEIQRGYVIIAD